MADVVSQVREYWDVKVKLLIGNMLQWMLGIIISYGRCGVCV